MAGLRSATYILRKSPGLSAAAVMLIALGIGWNTTIYSLIHGILTKPAPGITADHLVSFGLTTNGHAGEPEDSFPNYLDYAAQTKTVGPMLAFTFERFVLTLDEGSYEIYGAAVTRDYFETLGVRLVRGRSFTAEEAQSDSSGLAAVIGYRLWQEQFQGTANIIGRTVAVNGVIATIVGVAPPRFRGTWLTADLDFWVPLLHYSHIPAVEWALHDRSARSFGIIGRLRPGASLTQAQAEFATISKRLQAAYPDANKGRIVMLAPYSASAFGPNQGAQARLFMAILTVIALLTMLVVCANVANLMLARSVVRQREMAVRQSLGASRFRVVRLLFSEGLVLSLVALVAAWLFAVWASQAIVKLFPPNGRGVKLAPDFTPDLRVTVYAMVLALLSTLAFTLAPAVNTWRQELLPWLKAGEHNVIPGRSRLANILVVTQIALCFVLLTGAGLAWRSVSLLGTIDLKIKKDHLLLVSVDTAGVSRGGLRQNNALLERLRQRLLAVPGIVRASYARTVPPRFSWRGPIQGAGSLEPVTADGNFVGPDYMEALGVPNVIGRGIEEQDLAGSKSSAVINRNLADALWPSQPALGRTILVGAEKQSVEVVGVTPNGAFSGVERELHDGRQQNFIFFSERRNSAGPSERTFHLRYTGRLESITPAIRAAVREIDSRVPIASVKTMESHLAEFAGPAVLISKLLAMFSIGALILAATGLYAVVSFDTARRTRDFGIRMALGGSSRQILEGVLSQGMLLTTIGLTIGLALSAAAGRVLRGILFGVTPTDPPTYLFVIAMLAAVSLLACYIPARRAARTNPTEALRQE